MVSFNFQAILLFSLLTLLGALTAMPVHAGPPVNSSDAGVAIKGYDPVAYFTESRAVKGSRAHAFQWRESTWHFSTATHRELFVSDPERYAPKYGGF
jgi:hypothetical protein